MPNRFMLTYVYPLTGVADVPSELTWTQTPANDGSTFPQTRAYTQPRIVQLIVRAFSRRQTEGQRLPAEVSLRGDEPSDRRIVTPLESRFATKFVLVFLGGIWLFAALFGLLSDRNWSPLPWGRSAADYKGPVRPEFGLGSSDWEVKQILGQPTRVAGQCWYYGESKVCFRNDRVVSWYNAPDSPLRLPARR